MGDITPVSGGQREVCGDEVVLVRQPQLVMEAAAGPGLDLVLGNLVTLILGPVPLLRLRALLAEPPPPPAPRRGSSGPASILT